MGLVKTLQNNHLNEIIFMFLFPGQLQNTNLSNTCRYTSNDPHFIVTIFHEIENCYD